MFGVPDSDANANPEQGGRMMVSSVNSLSDDDGKQSPSPEQAQGLDDTQDSKVITNTPGSEFLSDIIEQRRQLADVFSAIRTLRGRLASQNIGVCSATTVAAVLEQPRSLKPKAARSPRILRDKNALELANMDGM